MRKLTNISNCFKWPLGLIDAFLDLSTTSVFSHGFPNFDLGCDRPKGEIILEITEMILDQRVP